MRALTSVLLTLTCGLGGSDGARRHRLAGDSIKVRAPLNGQELREGATCQSSPRLLPADSRVLVTGASGFIGMHLQLALNSQVEHVVGLDSYTPYYSTEYKSARRDYVKEMTKGGLEIVNGTTCDMGLLQSLLVDHKITHVIHLAAQAGVRYSQKSPQSYVHENVECFVELLETLRKFAPKVPLTYASSSSVYGLSSQIPFSETDPIDKPANLYGATKKHNEELAFAYHHLYGTNSVGLRFFTVYGPWGRPDMAAYDFTDRIANGRPLKIYNGGKMWRDMTFVSDIVQGIIASASFIGSEEDRENTGGRPQVFNLGNDSPVSVQDLIATIEKEVGKKAETIDGGASKGEIERTHADLTKARCLLGYSPSTSIGEGIRKTVEWYRKYHNPVFLTGKFAEQTAVA